MTKHLKKFDSHSQFESFIESGQRILHNVSYCKQEDHVHYDNYGVQPSVNNNGYEYVDLGLPSGTLWAKCNIGATHETYSGEAFAWGDVISHPMDGTYDWTCENYRFGVTCDHLNYTFSKYNSEDNKLVLDLQDDAAHVNMGGDWVMPQPEHIMELFDERYNTFQEEIHDENPDMTLMVITSKTNGNTLVLPVGFNTIKYINIQPYWTSVAVDQNETSYTFNAYGEIGENYYKFGGHYIRGIIPAKNTP